jgi:predicted MFS family arabinose efflux permease
LLLSLLRLFYNLKDNQIYLQRFFMLTPIFNTYKNAYSGLTRRMWLLSLVMFINRSGTMVLPFMTLYCSSRGYTPVQGGIAVAIYGIGSLVGAFTGGKLSDKIGFYYLQFISLFLGGIMFIILGQMTSFTGICVVIFFASMVNEAFRPANSSAIAYYSTAQNRTQSFSLNRLAINMGWGIGSALAGILSEISFNLLFWVDGFTNIASAVVLLLVLPKVTVAEQHQLHTHQEKKPEATPGPLRDKTFMLFVGFKVLFAFCFFQLFTTVPLFFNESLHLSKSSIGIIMAMNGIIIALFEMVVVFHLEGKRPYLRFMMYGTLLMALSYWMLNLPLHNGVVVATAAMLMITLAEIIAMPFMNSWYILRSTPANRGQYAALYTMAWSTAQVTGSLSGTSIAYAVGFNNLWWIIGGICLVTAWGYNYIQGRKS